MNKNVLVVGGAGYIGSHTTLALQAAGYHAVVYDNFSSGHRDACFGSALVEGDLADTAKLTQTMQDYDIGSVIHFAALIEAGQSVITPLPFFHNNVAGTLSLLDAMKAADVSRLLRCMAIVQTLLCCMKVCRVRRLTRMATVKPWLRSFWRRVQTPMVCKLSHCATLTRAVQMHRAARANGMILKRI